jgi:DNA-binding CsgD family transcriptional regulator
MKNWETLLELSCKKGDSIYKVIHPLNQYFDIDSLGYFKITRQGQFSYLTNKPDTMISFVEKGLMFQDPFYRHPNFFQSQLFVLGYNFSLESLSADLQKFLFKDAGYKGGFYYLEVTNEGVEGYQFGYTRDSARAKNFLQDKKFLDTFLTFFKNETKDMRSLVDRNSISLISEMGDLFFRSPHMLSGIEETDKQGFFKAMGLSQNEFIELHLTPREIDCIIFYLQRKTASETGLILNLSTRTIENYFETIKEKLHCRNKSEIYDKIKCLVLQGYYIDRLGRFF